MPEPFSPEQWATFKALFHELRELPFDARSQRFRERNSDADTVRQVERLLLADAQVGSQLDRPVILHMARDFATRADLHSASADSALKLDDESSASAGSMVGRRLGQYDVVRRIGEGGMGTVYEGHRADDAFHQRVAIKTVWRDVDSTLLARRLRSERQILATLQHPNIASLIDGGTTAEGLPYLVMEYVDGAPIDTWCDQHTLPIAQRLDLFRQACAAVAHAHRNLIVHRDLKPSNVFVSADGGVKLLDFGVAKLLGDTDRLGTLTGAGVSPFTIAFAAPEQVERAPITTATDVYALGALLYLLLTGHTFIDVEHRSVADAILAVREGVVTMPSDSALTTADAQRRGFASTTRLSRTLQGELDAIVMKAMRRDPARRYASVDALADDVHRFLRGDRVQAKTDTATYRLRTFVRRHRAAAVGIAVTAIGLVAGSAMTWRQADLKRVEALRAERASMFLMNMVGEPDAHFGDPFSRIGPNGRISELIDSSLVRVPVLFRDDPRIRARLYTALGASLTASGQARRAAMVLDSARQLARVAYGPTSNAYIEATVNAANAAVHFQPPRVAMALALDALNALDRSRVRFPELRARAMLAEATAMLLDGRHAEMDVVARNVIAMEQARTKAPTLIRAWAWRLRVAVLAPDSAKAALALAAAIADSIGAKRSIEHVDIQLQRAEFALLEGRFYDATRVADEALVEARAGFGATSREVALLQTIAIRVAVARKEIVNAVVLADALGVVVDSLRDINGAVMFTLALTRHEAYLAAGDLAHAERVDATFLRRVDRMETPISTLYGLAMAAWTHELRGEFSIAEREVRRALVVAASRPALGPKDAELRFHFARVLLQLGRDADAQAQIDSLPAAWRDRALALLRKQITARK